MTNLLADIEEYAEACALEYDPSEYPGIEEYVHQCADSSEYVIYYHYGRQLFASSSDFRELEYELDDLGDVTDSIDQRLTIMTFLYVSDRIRGYIGVSAETGA